MAIKKIVFNIERDLTELVQEQIRIPDNQPNILKLMLTTHPGKHTI